MGDIPVKYDYALASRCYEQAEAFFDRHESTSDVGSSLDAWLQPFLGNGYIGYMSKPRPQPISSGELKSLALGVVTEDRFPYLATMDGDQPRLRPISPVKTEGFTVYVANLRNYHKTAEIAANPKVELCYLDGHHDQVRITGVAQIFDDQQVLEEVWNANPLLRQYLGSLSNPELIVYRIDPHRVRYMREWALEYHDVPLE